jgi:hypothetical protein
VAGVCGWGLRRPLANSNGGWLFPKELQPMELLRAVEAGGEANLKTGRKLAIRFYGQSGKSRDCGKSRGRGRV